jgi:membrane protease YdiL (CAAX protease family)
MANCLPTNYARARRLCGAVLLSLALAKACAPVPYLGGLALAAAAFLQLWLPLRLCEAEGRPYAAVGLTSRHWAAELRQAASVAALFFPLYALGTHLLLTQLHRLHPQAPVYVLQPRALLLAPTLSHLLALGQSCFTQVLGVALPEETFFRGYLQPQLQQRFGAQQRLRGVPVGRGLGLTALCFALAHFIGEWQPARLLPFFPGLLFGWQRNVRGSVVGAIGLHAACNLFAQACLSAYTLQP